MRRIEGSVFVSLDGVMQAPGGPSEDPTGGFAHGGWMFGHSDEAVGAAVGRFFDRPYALLLGRRTYDIFAGYWPFMPPDHGIADGFNAAHKHVLTRGGAALDWANSHALPDLTALAELRAGDGPDLLIQGSGTLYPQLLAAGLLDRLTVMMHPVVLGEGKRLFGDGTPAGALAMVAHEVTPGGVVIATYETAGSVRPGSYARIEPSPRERDRQRAIAENRW